jgi:hypothetical protein
MFDIEISRYIFGGNNTRDSELFSDQPVDDWTKNHNYFQDFDDYFGPTAVATPTVGGFTLSGAGSTVTQPNVDGGVISINAAASTPTSLQKQGHFMVRAGLRTFFRQLISVDNVLGLVLAGLTNVTGTPFTGGQLTDGWWFSSTNTGALSFNVATGGVVTTAACGVSLIGGNFATLGAYWDGALYSQHQPNGVIVWECAPPPFGLASGLTGPARGSISAPANFPSAALLAFLSGVSPSTAAARALQVDYWYGLKDRVNFTQTPTF